MAAGASNDFKSSFEIPNGYIILGLCSFDTAGYVSLCFNAIMLGSNYVSIGLTNTSNNALNNVSYSITISCIKNNIWSINSDYRNKLSEVNKTTDNIKSGYKKHIDGSVDNSHGFNEFITQGQYNVCSNAGTGNGNPHDAWCYGILLVFVNTGDKYNGQNNWLWQIFLQTDATIWQRTKINNDNWSAWKQIT